MFLIVTFYLTFSISMTPIILLLDQYDPYHLTPLYAYSYGLPSLVGQLVTSQVPPL